MSCEINNRGESLMKTILRYAGTILLSFLLVVGMGTGIVIAEKSAKLSVSYTFTGDEAEKAGFAQGEITITPGEGALSSGYYLVYYADDTDTLKGYDELASVEITGSTVTYTVKDGLMIPAGATKIAVFESETRFWDETPSIADASAVADIPASKQLTLDTPEMTFGAVSDVHMNYEGYRRGAYQKWGNALSFFAEKNMDYLIVTGDMTGDTTLDLEYETYNNIINESNFPIENVYESIGNHGNTPSDIALFTQYTSGEGEDHPYEGSPYYSVLIKGKTSKARDNLFIFMAQEIKEPGDSVKYDNFSKEQIDWLEGLLTKYGNTGTNIFIIEHSPFLNFGPGDRHPGGYTALVTFKEEYTQTMRLKSLLETYKDAIVMSGHTHLTLYDTENYSNENDSFSHMVHVGSTCYPCGYGAGKVYTRGTDGRYDASKTYGSEGYLVSVYSDYIVYTGYNLSTGKIIPAACLLIPTTDVPASGSGIWLWCVLAGAAVVLIGGGVGMFVYFRSRKTKKAE